MLDWGSLVIILSEDSSDQGLQESKVSSAWTFPKSHIFGRAEDIWLSKYGVFIWMWVVAS